MGRHIRDILSESVHSKSLFSSLYPSALLLLAAGVVFGADPFTDEQYAVYSAVLANIQFSHADRNRTLVIVRDTLDPRKLPIPTEDCRTLPDEVRRRIEDISALRREPSAFASRTLGEKKLVIGRPYVLISPQTAEQWQKERFSPKIPTDPPGEESPNPFPGSTDLIRISNILFNANKTTGLVYVSATCGTLCGLSQWNIVEKNIVEKSLSVWRVFSTPGCGTIN